MRSELLHTVLFAPWESPRLWVTFLWSLALSTGVGALDWAERDFKVRAATCAILLLPANDLDAGKRMEAQRELTAKGLIARSRWLSPDELLGDITRRFDQPDWRAFLPADSGWLPWVLEVLPTSPLDQIDSTRVVLSRLQAEEGWLALWDEAEMRSLAIERSAVRAGLGSWLLIAGLAGSGALLRIPRPLRGGWASLVWAGVLGVAGPAMLWLAASLAGAGLDERCLFVAAGAGFILATLAASMLRRRGNAALSLRIGESPDERSGQSPDSNR